MFKVFVTRMIPQEGLEILRKECHVEVFPHDRPISREELLKGVMGREGLLCLLTDRVDKEVIEAGRGLRVISNYAIGYNNIDIEEATRRGIVVTNTPGVLTEVAVAETAWALLFSVSRKLLEGDRLMRSGGFQGWAPMLLLGSGVGGKTLGIVGAGGIGQSMALMSRGFGMKVLYSDMRRNEVLERELGAKKVDLHSLLRESDFVSLHMPLTPETYHLMGAKELGLMKKTAYLINMARGPIIDEKALVEALRKGIIAGAGLDVYEEEPRLAPGLAELYNVVLAPHLGSATIEARREMAVMAAEDLLAVLKGQVPENVVNPSVLKRKGMDEM